MTKCQDPKCKPALEAVYGGAYRYPVHCKDHRLDGEINTKNVRCDWHDGCTKQPNFALSGEKATRCSTHSKTGNYTDIRHKKCNNDKCSTQPTFGHIGKRPERCFIHRLATDIDVVNKNKNCTFPNCTTRANFGIVGGKPDRCSVHTLPGYIDLMNKNCDWPRCNTLPTFGFPGEKHIRCVDHKIEGMVDVKNRTCKYEKCAIQPKFGIPGQVPTLCSTHKTDYMVDVYHTKTCIDCSLPFRKSGTREKCLYCDPPKQLLRHETKVKTKLAEALDSNLAADMIHNKTIEHNQRCCKYRPDFFWDLQTHILIVEVDENQHESYEKDCETVRMHRICESFGWAIPVVFVRYNPDPYYTDGKKCNPPFEERMELLVSTIYDVVEMDLPQQLLTIKYLYYDTSDP